LAVMQLNNAMDLQMMALLSAKERTRADWEALLRTADQRLRIANARQPASCAEAVIEVVSWIRTCEVSLNGANRTDGNV
jgi:hypothetical protein